MCYYMREKGAIMSETFFGRGDLIANLSSLWRKKSASLVTCRGRRRIGKSTLIRHFAEKSKARFLKVEGLKPKQGMSNADELAFFAATIAGQTGVEQPIPRDWLTAFRLLDQVIVDKERTVVLLDEVSWMAYFDVTFSSVLKSAWDNLFKRHPKLVLVVCGSVSTWIKDNIIDDGAFFGRRSLDIVVPELPVSDCVRFWGRAAERIDKREILDVLSVTGGVPRYLEEVDPSLSAMENLRRMAFSRESILRVDFDEMFNDVITRQPTFTASVLRCLTSDSRTVSEIATALGIERNGHVSDALNRLVESGIVAQDAGRNPQTGANIREIRFRICDNYTRFYLRYIDPVKKTIDSGAYRLGVLEGLPEWSVVMGLAFENLVVGHVREIIERLGLGSALILSAAPYRRAATKSAPGVQVDLLIQAQRTVCVVEIKRRSEIGRSVIDEVAEKISKLAFRPGVSVRTVLVYEGRLSPQVEAEGYFDLLLPFHSLIEPS